MSPANDNQGFIEIYDLTTKQAVARAPLDEIRFIPRVGERVFIPIDGPGDWHSYTVVTVEYFLGYQEGTAQPARRLAHGRITLYVEASK